MSVTSGFFNSLNGDRRYTAEQMSAIFNGIINDGVFSSIGDGFTVNSAGSNNLTIGIGRAWFNGTWLFNDAILPLEADVPEVVLERYDAVVIEINHSDNVRAGLIRIVKGLPSSTPVYPEMSRTKDVNQYPLAYIHRKANANEITQADITNVVGTSSCPYITGILQTQNTDKIVAQWEAQWNQWFANKTNSSNAEMTQWMVDSKASFETWFNEMQLSLEGEAAVQLASKIIEIQNRFEALHKSHIVTENLKDSNSDALLDSSGTPIQATTALASVERVERVAKQNTPGGMVIILSANGWLMNGEALFYRARTNGIMRSDNIIVSPNPFSHVAWCEYGVRAIGQSDDYVEFTADSKPEVDVTVNILVFGAEANV